MDSDQSGSISKEEIQEVIVYNHRVSAKLESLDISVNLEELMEIFDTILHAQNAEAAAHVEHIRPNSSASSPDPQAEVEAAAISAKAPPAKRSFSRSQDETTIPIDQFVSALTAIRGQATSKETFLMRQEIKAIAHRQEEMFHMFQKFMEDQ